jgi:putative ABC transport system permease protein
VAQRTHEIGAWLLGLTERVFAILSLGKAWLTAGLGVIVGLAAAAFLARFLAGFLFGVRAWDPMVFIGVPVLPALNCAIYSVDSARRAARLEPVEALRG